MIYISCYKNKLFIDQKIFGSTIDHICFFSCDVFFFLVFSITMICFILAFAVIIWLRGLLWSQFSCNCYCNSQWEEYVCVMLVNWLIMVQFFVVYYFNALSVVLDSLSKLTGLMLAAREKTHQVIIILTM